MTSLESARARIEVLTAEANELRTELATERGKRCATCDRYLPPDDTWLGGVCGSDGSPRKPEQGCTEWEAKP